ncbi:MULTISPECIES: MFS transporter [Bradyrhizobium]|uniref:MFS transporter n=1 Tax=Bradyrhizobium arachidis TaxID=858423 RepID=A0AAE7NRR4_9BRAD|nr:MULTISPECIES: MFS transporter [Bradyrhizobium]QOG18105.1 MFS transporter [Bradyrhizobium sp. SEMIA]QOZ67519.1 MFS transporter [Bradyrhizobium arachidis]UFW52135.1 MFS transporter [Bradyrhizobium arachidis]SFU82756.1 MFS transporter, AAHS family, 4-hydroxybenzoate transporter [Bradyrhizobium arachidis]
MSISSEIDVHEELSGAPIGPFHKLLGILITLITLFDGYDTFNPAYVIHYVAQPWGLAPSQAGFLVSSGLVGFLFGAIGHGSVADRFGRRGTLLAGLWIVNVFTLLTAVLASDFWSYCALRFVTGLGLGVLLPLGTTFINELAPKRVSNTFSLWGVTLGWSLGGVAAGLVGVFLTPHYGWQILYYIGALSIPLTFVAHALLPESPRFLASRSRIPELRALLARLRPERAPVYRTATFTSAESKPPQSTIGALLSPRYRRVSLTIWVTAFLSLFAIFGLTGWIPTVMLKRGETFAASFGFGALMQAMSFIGGLTLAMLADRNFSLTPRYLATWWLTGGIAVLALVFVSGHGVNLAIVAVAGFCIIGAQHVLNNFTAGSYETCFRASGVGMELGIGRVGAILGPYVIGLLQQITGGPDAVFWAIGGASIVGALAIGSLGAVAARRLPSADAAPAE